MTTPVTGTGSGTTTAPTTSTTGAQRNDDLGKDAFLQLMVAQLRYQDPMSPSNPQDFLAQTAQFTVVEKLDALTKLGETSSKAQTLAAGSALVGRTVSWYGEDGAITSGKVEAALASADGVRLHVGSTDVPLDGVVRVT